MTITTEQAERLAERVDFAVDDPAITATAIRSLAAERDALRAENARLREALSKTIKILVAAFNRIHGLPRTTDTELSTEIEKCLGEIRRVREETQ